MTVKSTEKCSLRRVVREAVRLKDLKENETRKVSLTVKDIEKEIEVKIKLLNTKNEYHLPTTISGGIHGLAETF